MHFKASLEFGSLAKIFIHINKHQPIDGKVMLDLLPQIARKLPSAKKPHQHTHDNRNKVCN